MAESTGVQPAFGLGGQELWEAFDSAVMPAPQRALLVEACRAKDRLDKLDLILCGDVETWATLTHRTRTEDYELLIDDALAKANSTSTALRQLIAALPDAAPKQKAVNALDELTNRRKARAAAAPRATRPARGS